MSAEIKSKRVRVLPLKLHETLFQQAFDFKGNFNLYTRCVGYGSIIKCFDIYVVKATQ